MCCYLRLKARNKQKCLLSGFFFLTKMWKQSHSRTFTKICSYCGKEFTTTSRIKKRHSECSKLARKDIKNIKPIGETNDKNTSKI